MGLRDKCGNCAGVRFPHQRNANNFVTNYRVPSNADLQAAEAAASEGPIVLKMRYMYLAGTSIEESEATLQKVHAPPPLSPRLAPATSTTTAS